MTTAWQEKENRGKGRDVDLDIYRGCIMIYITCFIHNIYGVTNAYSVVTSYFLIEMPLIFFIAGAAHSLARPRPYLPYLWGRVKRIVFPYYILVGFVTLYHFIVDCGAGGETPSDFLSGFLQNGYYNIFTGRLYEFNALWFVPVYLAVAALLPVMDAVKQRLRPAYAYLLLGCAIGAIALFPNAVLCYTIFTFAGLYYRKESPVNRWVILLLSLLLMACCIGSHRYAMDMQVNKFPPNLYFLAYTSLVLVIGARPLAWLCRRLYQNATLRRCIDLYARSGFTIYLYHGFNIIWLQKLFHYIAVTTEPTAIGYAVLFALASLALLLSNAILGIIMQYVETRIIRCGETVWHKGIKRWIKH